MKRLLLALPCLALIAAACEEPFTPKAPFTPKPVVTCIISGNNKGFSATATVATTYDVSGLDPLENRTDPFDTNAVVMLTIGGDNDTLKLGRSKRADTSRYTTKEFKYSLGGTLPYYNTGSIALTVKMGDGRRVSASCTAPRGRVIESSYQFVAGVTARTTDPLWTFDWNNEQRDDHLYFPKLQLAYQVAGPKGAVYKTVEIPMRYLDKDGKHVPVYPSFTRDLKISYDFAALERAVASISEGDTLKSRYTIGMLTFTLIEYDLHLSNYYASSHGYLDEYSIRVDETTYSNLSGGIGIFGWAFTNQLPFEMNSRFIKSFGYQM